MMKYAPLYLKTHNSLLSSMIKIPDLVEYASHLGYESLAISDDTMYGVMDFYKACLNSNIKPIIGLELSLNEKKIVLYCKDVIGYKNLNHLFTLKTTKELNIVDLEKYSEGLICILPYESKELCISLSKIYEYLFQGYVNSEQRQEFKQRNCIYFDEILYLKKEDSKYISYLYSIRDSKVVENYKIKQNNYLKSIDEFEKLIENDKKNYELIDSLCKFEIPMNQDLLPIYKCPNNISSYDYLKQLCIDGMKKRFGTSVSKIYLDRLKYELSVIDKMGFCNYFLVVYDYVKFAKDSGILVGPGRGSAAGSLVSYCLFITEVDPIKYHLLFERFLNPERVTMPDIDIDFEYNRREEVINYCISKYGKKHVAPIITFGTLGAKQAIRDVGRAMDIDLKLIDILCKFLDSHMNLKENLSKNIKLKEFIKYNKLQTLYDVSSKLEGLKRHTSIHAAGIVMCRDDLDNYIPLDGSHMDFYTTGYSMEYLENIGLLKMDFLALRNLSLITNVLNEVDVDLKNISLNDQKTLKLFYEASTIGIFQFESGGMINFLRKLKVNSFEDLVAAVALFRPGPMNNIDSYIKRKQGIEKIDYIHSDLEDILKPTYGILIYQEQIMQVANVMAGYSFGEADILRRAMSKKKESVMLDEKDKFISRSVARGYSKEVSIKVYALILKFASYGFNRAHSVAYALLAYQMAYLKANYSKYFMYSLLTMVIGSSVNTKKYIYECRLLDINILKPDINHSTNKYDICENGIIFPFNCIKNIGDVVVNRIVDERNKGQFSDIFDFLRRCYDKSVSKKIILNLNDAGCFLSLGITKKTLELNLDSLLNYAEISQNLDEEFILKPVLEECDEYDNSILMQKEYDVFGFYLSNHPITDYKVKKNIMLSIDELELYFDKIVNIILYIDQKKEITTKNNDKMCFITGSDEVSTIEVVLFPKIYEKNNNIDVNNVINIKARVEKRFDKYQLIVNDLEILK